MWEQHINASREKIFFYKIQIPLFFNDFWDGENIILTKRFGVGNSGKP